MTSTPEITSAPHRAESPPDAPVDGARHRSMWSGGRHLFNEGWHYRARTTAFQELGGAGTAEWTEVVLPHDAIIATERRAEVPRGETTGPSTVREPVSAGYIWLLSLTILGGYVAFVAPVGIGLSLRVQEIAPDNVEVLGYVVGAGAAVAALSAPLTGMWSDRLRSRFGRRRPFALCGSILGFLALGMLAWAPSIPLLTVGWMLGQLGWGTAVNSLLLSQADRLPEEQRGRVGGLSGFVQMVAAVLGVSIASAFIGNNYLVFLVPGAIGLSFFALWVPLVKEPNSRDLLIAEELSFRTVLTHMVFNPREHPDFAWNWLGRLFFNFGVPFATTFMTLFFASRLSTSGQVAHTGRLIAILALTGVVATGGGALLGGFLSDKESDRTEYEGEEGSPAYWRT
ncbi:MFS transporter [Streptomyces viridochromogenes]|uniref:MFS transporter n=1 Tax=Streptomyces viridochromogenes TaxID=1938 RepID=UPI00099C0710|nr:MFS transporter [Streptomyces viridochromogenes]